MSVATEISRLQQAKADIKTAIEAKGVTVPANAKLDDYDSYVAQIEGGGGGGGETGGDDVIFYDYDGTIVNTYSASDFAQLTAMPANPSHSGLTAQGWNWTLSDAQAYVASYGKLDIGQTYITDDGKTRIYIHLEEGRLSPMLGICPSGTVVVDWGDGSATDTLTGTSLTTVKWTPTHNYAADGDYVITLTVTGSANILGADAVGTGSYLLHQSSSSTNVNSIYRNAIHKVELGANIGIGTNAFYYCNSLTHITIPSGVTTINSSAFYNCYSLKSVTFPSGMTSIGGNYAFRNCYSLGSISMPKSFTSIGSYAFYGCYNLTNVTIPDRITSISAAVFGSCYALANIVIPSGVTSIGSLAFDNCRPLKSIKIPSGVTSIGSNAFNYCYCLTSITIPSGVTSISQAIFRGCYALSSITIPSGVTSIGNDAFYDCYSLKSITIPSAVTSMGNNVFRGCYSLTSITIPSGVTSIGSYAFYGCSSLKSISIPNTITSIGTYAFYNCAAVASITIPSGVTNISTYTFYGCWSLASITIPSSVTSISNNYAFSNCYGVAEYHFLSTTPPTLANTNAFNNIPADCKIYVPAASLEAYQTATNWSTYASYMVGE